MIEVKSLSRHYGDFLAVDQLSFKAKQGEILGLLGPNGAGKTTTMRMLTGYLPPSSGTALIDHHDIVRDSVETRKRIGYLPERVPIYPDMTVRGYVLFWAQLRGTKEAKSRTDMVLKQFDLYTRKNTLVRHLSKGLKQRLGLAQALVHDPPVLILDEPTIGIDPQQVIEVRDVVKELGKQHTILFSTHILTEAEEICDRVLIIDHGRIVAQGTPQQLQKEIYSTQYYVQVGGGKTADVRALLQSISGVAEVSAEKDGFLVKSTANEDLRAAISTSIVSAGYTVLEIHQRRSTLEDIFLAAIKAAPGAQAGKKAKR
ncbi:MAG: ABC transporter ATP-binding protein [Anaerolineae bacterium]|nr:ABC transporter ATP-binding protein [Anaerolineae bacterium]